MPHTVTFAYLVLTVWFTISCICTNAGGSSSEGQVCAHKLVNLIQNLCDNCIDYWPADGAGNKKAPEGFENAGHAYGYRINEVVSKYESGIAKIPFGDLEKPANLDDLIISCCMLRKCSYATIRSYCCPAYPAVTEDLGK